jgi:hypothetical protein
MKREDYVRTYTGKFEELFEAPLLYTGLEWEAERDISWSSKVAHSCKAMRPMRETRGKKKVKKGFVFDFIVFVTQDDGSDLDHFYAFSTRFGSERHTKHRREIRRIRDLLKSLTTLAESNTESEAVTEDIERLMYPDDRDENALAFVFTVNQSSEEEESG